MERFTAHKTERPELLACIHCIEHSNCYSGFSCSEIYNALSKLRYYENLEEQGKLPVLPCKPHDKVWLNEWWNHYGFNKWEKLSSPIERNVTYFSIESDGVYAHFKDGCINVEYFGKIAFLTHEEAEDALSKVER